MQPGTQIHVDTYIYIYSGTVPTKTVWLMPKILIEEKSLCPMSLAFTLRLFK